MGDPTWPPELRYRFYRAWNTQMFGLAALALAPAFQFSAATAVVFFVGGGSVMFCGAIMSRSALREADRSTRWRNFMPRLEDWPPLAVRRLDPDQADLRRWADASTVAVVVAFTIGYAGSMIVT